MPRTFLPSFKSISPWKRTLYIMFLAQIMTAIGFSVSFPFLPLYVKGLGTHTALSIEFLAGMVFSTQAVTMAIASPIWGSISDRYGRKIMVERAMYGGAVMMLWMAFVGSAEELILARTLQGFVTGIVSAANALVASVAPRERAGYAMGLLQVGLGIGIAVGPFMGGLMADWLGYRMTFVITSVFLLLSGLLVSLGVKEVFQPKAQTKQTKPGILTNWQRILTAPGVPETYILRFAANLGRMMIFPIAPLFIQTLLASDVRLNTYTGLIVGISATTGTLTAVYFGKLGDRIGHRTVLQGCALAACLFYLPQSFVTAAWQLFCLQALTGAAGGGIIPTLSALLTNYTQPGEEGSVYGLDNSISSAARGIAPLLGAACAYWFNLRSVFALTSLIFLGIMVLAIWKLPSATQIAEAK